MERYCRGNGGEALNKKVERFMAEKGYSGVMNVGELKRMLEKYPDNMVLLVDRYSDYDVVQECEWSVVKAVPQNGGEWVMRSHETMSAANKELEQEFLHLDGN